MIPEWDSLSSNTGGSLRLKFTCFVLSLFSVASVALLKLSPASLQPTQNGRLYTSCSSLCYHWSYQRLVVALLSRKWASRSKFYLRKDEGNTEIWTWSWYSQITISSPPPPGSDHRQNASEITAEEGLTDHERWRRVRNCSGASQPQLCAALLHWKVETKLLWTGYDLSPSSIIIPDFIC